MPAALAAQYVAMALVFVFGLYAISRGVILEPPSLVTNAVTLLSERVSRRFATT